MCYQTSKKKRRSRKRRAQEEKEKMGKGVVSEKVKLVVALITLQFCFAGFHIVSRVALNIGVSKVVYPVYRNLLALLLIGPFAYFFEK